MATKTTDKKNSGKKTTGNAAPTPVDPVETLATDVLLTVLHRALVRLGEPVRAGEIARETQEESITPALARHLMETHPRRFIAVDRRWDLTERYLDKQKSVDRLLAEVIGHYGAPMPVGDAVIEMSHIYGRPKEYFDGVVPRLLRGPNFFPVSGGTAYGLRAWLLDTSAEAEEDILFYNYMTPESVAAFTDAAEGADWEDDPVGAAGQVIVAADGQPVDNRLLQFFAFRVLGEEFDAAALYDAMYTQGSAELLCLPEHRWLRTESLAPVRTRWQALAAEAAEMTPEEAVAEPAAVEAPAKPLEVTSDDLEALRRYFGDLEEITTAHTLLTDVLDIPISARSFAADAETLTEFLRSHPQEFVWVGTDRFRAPDTLPPYIGQVPDSLKFPVLPRFETADGEILDQMLEDSGFEETLLEEILDPVAQDVNDQEPAELTRWLAENSAEGSSLRLVLKAHHKEIGTFPLAQVPPGFFPTEPEIVELTLRDTTGNSYPIYVDYDVQLVYGLFDVYAEIAADAGAVFALEKTDSAAEYLFVSINEADNNAFVSPARYEELIEFRGEVEAGPVSTYDIIRRILDHYRKGCSFLTLLTEVNLVRRTPRRLIASILSGYHAFHLRAGRWNFDPKREPEGFDRTKTPFLVKH